MLLCACSAASEGEPVSLESRLHKLEAQIQPKPLAWSADVEACRARAAARVRLHVGERLNIPWHPSVVSARELLIGDTPEQKQADLDTLQRWGREHPELLAPDDGWRERFNATLDETAQRINAGKRAPADELRAQD
jgi:hypothetical protein